MSGSVGRLRHRQRALALEAKGIVPPKVRESRSQVGAEAVHGPAKVHVLEHGIGEALKLGSLLGGERPPHRLGGRHLSGHLLKEVVEALGPGEHVAELFHELLEGRVKVLAALALLKHLAERVHRGAGAGDLFGIGIVQELGHALEVGVGDLLADLLLECFECFSGLSGGELIGAERPHAAREVVREQVERHPSLGHHLVGDLLAPLVPRVASLRRQLVKPRALHLLDLAEPIAVAGQLPVRVTLLEKLLSAATGLVEEVAKAVDPFTVGQLEPIAQQTLERVREVSIGQQVVFERGEQVLGIEV